MAPQVIDEACPICLVFESDKEQIYLSCGHRYCYCCFKFYVVAGEDCGGLIKCTKCKETVQNQDSTLSIWRKIEGEELDERRCWIQSDGSLMEPCEPLKVMDFKGLGRNINYEVRMTDGSTRLMSTKEVKSYKSIWSRWQRENANDRKKRERLGINKSKKK